MTCSSKRTVLPECRVAKRLCEQPAETDVVVVTVQAERDDLYEA